MYNNERKKQVRRLVINHAITSLTINRQKSLLCSLDFTKKLYHHINNYLKTHGSNKYKRKKYTSEQIFTINQWIPFFEGYSKSINPQNLKILYLAGPNPENDFNELVAQGVSPYNIWAIESDNEIYSDALKNLYSKNIPIRFYKTNLKHFLETVQEKFHIVYADYTSPLFSKRQNPILDLQLLFSKRRLEELSCLITNFSELKDNKEEWKNLILSWFAVQSDDSRPRSIYKYSKYEDIANFNYKKISKHKNIDDLYSPFIHSFVSFLSNRFCPALNTIEFMGNNSDNFIKAKEMHKSLEKYLDIDYKKMKSEERFMHIMPMLDPKIYGLIAWSRYCKENLGHFAQIAGWLMHPNSYKVTNFDILHALDILYNYEQMAGNKFDIVDMIVTERLKKFLRYSTFFDRELRLTVDIPMMNLLVDLFWGLIGYPNLMNPEAHLSLSYTANTNKMFTDVFVFDQCRYLFNLLPSLESTPLLFKKSHSIQLLIRSLMDQIRKKILLVDGFYFWASTVESDGFHIFPKKIRRKII
ncbi:hypothetical protein [Leptospira kmetyi]|uniref:Uncharacterized protein n=1 Tax=Leptospira kmetyi TaxID=408139 RepID=A0ABX4N8A9_9LEPT|nr:hypothetical protein [Leptospira kmetyi]PJZ28379.1 hypothetical protein CH378_18040 [Leptospira kmetyi]